MATANLSAFLRRLTRGMAAETLGDRSDRQLVEKFLAGRDAVAFEAIVRRHGPMVYRACWRVLQQDQDAEDAFQATFLLLAQKLRTVRKHASLASWLHGVAHRVALKVRAQDATRRRHERQAPVSRAMTPDAVTWGELRLVLDAELAQLPEKWRLPLILCYLEGRTQDEAAGQLGWGKNTLRRRLDEARAALGRRLSRRGVVWPAALSAVLLSDCVAPAAAPPGLVGPTVEAAARIAAGQAATTAAKAATLATAGQAVAQGVVSVKVAALTEGALQTMFVSKLKMVLTGIVTVCALASGVGALTYGIVAQFETDSRNEKPAEKADKEAAGPKAAPETQPLPEVLKQALQTAEEVVDPAEKVRCLGWVAKAQHLAGDGAASRATLQQAAKIVDSMPLEDVDDASAKFNLLHFLSAYQAGVGNFEAAKKTVAKIQKPNILGIGEKQVAGSRAWALAGIAVQQAKAGKFKDALETAANIDKDYEGTTFTDWKGWGLKGIAEAQALTGDWKEALRTATGIKDDQQRAQALTAIAKHQAKARNLDDARESLKAAVQVAEKIPAEKDGFYTQKVYILSQIAWVQAEMGDAKEALQTAELIPANPRTKKQIAPEKQILLLQVKLQAGDCKGALEVAEQIPETGGYPNRNHALTLVADAQAQARDFKGAIETLKKMRPPSKATTAVALARVHAQAGDKEAALKLLQQAARDAEEVAYDSRNDFGKPLLAYNIAFAWAEIGEEKAAQEWIAKESSLYVRTYALLGVVDGVAKREGKKQRVIEWE